MNLTDLFKRRCLFCAEKAKLTNEHIIPLWLLSELNLCEKGMVGTHLSSFGLVRSQRKHNFNRLLNGLICKKCNTGWMSELENVVQPILAPIINRKVDANNACQVLTSNHELIAKWVFKTALVLNYGTNYRKLVPLDHFRSLYNSMIPKGVYVNLGFANEVQDISWRQEQTIFVTGDNEKITRLIAERVHYKITFQFKYLLLRICYFPFDDFTLDPKMETSIFLWPQLGIYKELKPYENLVDFATRCAFIQVSG